MLLEPLVAPIICPDLIQLSEEAPLIAFQSPSSLEVLPSRVPSAEVLVWNVLSSLHTFLSSSSWLWLVAKHNL